MEVNDKNDSIGYVQVKIEVTDDNDEVVKEQVILAEKETSKQVVNFDIDEGHEESFCNMVGKTIENNSSPDATEDCSLDQRSDGDVNQQIHKREEAQGNNGGKKGSEGRKIHRITDENQCDSKLYVCHKCRHCVKGRNNYDCHMKRHLQLEAKKRHCLCEFCGKNFVDMQGLKAHLRIHTGARPYKCPFKSCPKAYKSAGLLKLHKDIVHLNISRFSCKYCSKKFARKGSLTVHIANLHVRKEEKFCPVCGEYFGQITNLICHIKSHEDPKILTCQICYMKFKHKSALGKHTMLHRTNGYTCSECGDTFTRPSYLREHQWKHTGQKKFECTVCKKTFSQKGNLRTHARTKHSEDIQLFYCSGCNKGFNVKSNMKAHERRCVTVKKKEADEEKIDSNRDQTVEKDVKLKLIPNKRKNKKKK